MSPAQPPLLANLLRTLPEARLIETHISWVIVAGGYAYKLKKPVNLGFLDFSTLDKRRTCCKEEIRLNRRLAPDIYLAAIPITGSADAPVLGGKGEAIEWAVQMRAFPADATLDREAQITPQQIDALADRIAAFHLSLGPASGYGAPAQIQAPALENLAQLAALPLPDDLCARLTRIEAWTRNTGARLEPVFLQRQKDGCIRECHGDLHLGNIAWVDDAPLIFDCIEFNLALRCIDVQSEIAFLVMDLTHRDQEALAWRALNRYLETTGDYAGLAVLPYYLVYRALVRAKVEAIRAHQAGDDFALCRAYLDLAERLARPRRAQLLLMHGVSGSGKSWRSQHALEALGAIRLRADVERKRLFGLGPLDSSRAIPGGIYTREAGARTLARLLECAEALLAQGWTVILDATFLSRSWREPCVQMAQRQGAPWRILSLEAAPDTLRARLHQRTTQGGDASEADLAVLESQLAHQDALTPEEAAHTLNGAAPLDSLLSSLSVSS
ncbi:MAG: AAA family ATPase [Betaproteobacteria bacterium]|nr:AAA family ATPase [Betaproteobacteria bacterium]